MKQRILTTLSLLLALLPAAAQEARITVDNPTAMQRHETVATPLDGICRQLGVQTGTPLVVRNALGQQVVSQQTYDGLLLIFASVQPHGQAVFTVRAGQPQAFPSEVQGAVYKSRLDDLTWENDRGIYRVYGPALQRRGEKAYGTDVWVKNTPEPVVADRYRTHFRGMALRDSLRRAGKAQEAREMDLATSFHHDHGRGLDCYGVGPTLGCGAPALMTADGQLRFPYCYQQCRILDNGPLRFTAQLDYGTTADGVTEHRLISLDKASHFNRCTVWYDGISQPTTLATGVVLHGGSEPVLDSRYVLYADPTENPKAHQSQIYVATLFPDGISETRQASGHALGLLRGYSGQRYTYWFGSAWSRYDVPTQAHWQLCVEQFLEQLKQPLTVTVK